MDDGDMMDRICMRDVVLDDVMGSNRVTLLHGNAFMRAFCLVGFTVLHFVLQ
jgi:hypothetical protein